MKIFSYRNSGHPRRVRGDPKVIYTHYSYDEQLVIAKEFPKEYTRERFDKPVGMWISHDDEGGWRDWCEAENFGGTGSFRYELTLVESSNLLRLSSYQELLDFTEQYKDRNNPINDIGNYAIEWERISSLYQGIMIFPYIWDARFCNKTSWYYCWDCACGCIWDFSIIDHIQRKDLKERSADGQESIHRPIGA